VKLCDQNQAACGPPTYGSRPLYSHTTAKSYFTYRNHIPHIKLLALLFTLALPFVRIATLPYVDAKIQPTELVFLFLAPLALWTYGRSLWPKDRWLQAGFITYLAANVVSAAVSENLAANLEAVGRIYLAFMALIVGRWVSEAPQKRARKMMDYFLYGTAALAIITYIGYISAVINGPNSMVQVYGNYPYLGTVVRAKGFTAGAGMLIIVLLLPTLYAWRGWRDGRLKIWWFALLLPLAFLTFAKEVLLLGLGLLLVEPLVRKVFGRGRRVQGLLIGAVALTFWLATHYIVQERQPFAESSLAGTSYTAGVIVWEGTDYQVIETSYTALKKAGAYVATQHPVIGVGPGQFGRALPAAKAAGHYPEHLPDYDPHSTWLGALSETGAFGFIGLLLLVCAIWRNVAPLTPAIVTDDIRLCLLVFLLLILIMSVSKDVMNFRFVWWGIGLLLGLPPNKFGAVGISPTDSNVR
jgi:hypothetical protein